MVLERRARAEKLPFQDVQRARIVLYAAEGLHDTEIAARLDTSPALVGRWRRRFAEQRLDGLKDKPRAGRPRRFSPAAGRRREGDRVRAAGPVRVAADIGPFAEALAYITQHDKVWLATGREIAQHFLAHDFSAVPAKASQPVGEAP